MHSPNGTWMFNKWKNRKASVSCRFFINSKNLDKQVKSWSCFIGNNNCSIHSRITVHFSLLLLVPVSKLPKSCWAERRREKTDKWGGNQMQVIMDNWGLVAVKGCPQSLCFFHLSPKVLTFSAALTFKRTQPFSFNLWRGRPNLIHYSIFFLHTAKSTVISLLTSKLLSNIFTQYSWGWKRKDIQSQELFHCVCLFLLCFTIFLSQFFDWHARTVYAHQGWNNGFWLLMCLCLSNNSKIRRKLPPIAICSFNHSFRNDEKIYLLC